MIKFIKITNYKNEELMIDLFNPYTSGFYIAKIDGLCPVKADITTTKMVTTDGDIYNHARANSRNIILTLGFIANNEIGLHSIEDCRQKTYKYFPLKKRLKFSIMTDNRELYTYGYVESNEPDIFSQEETAQISIICPSSYFTSNDDNTVMIKNVRPMFKFPFEVLEEDLPAKDLMERGKEYSKTIIVESGQGDQFYGNEVYNLYKNESLYGDLEGTRYTDLENYTYENLGYYTKNMEVIDNE